MHHMKRCMTFAHLHRTHTVKDSRGMHKGLMGIFCQECVYDVVSSLGYLPNFLCKMWGCFPFKFGWLRGYIYNYSYYHYQIRSINLTHCFHIFPWLCVWGGCTNICCQLHIYLYIHISWESWVLFLDLLCSLMMCANNRVHYGLIVIYGYLHITLPEYHHYADLSESIELQKCFSDIFCLECVSKIRSVLSIIFHAIYGAVCIQLTCFSYDDCDNPCTWSYHHYQIWSMPHLPLFRVRS